MRKSISIVTALVVALLLVGIGNSEAQQMTDLQRGNWLLGVVFKLEGMRDDALADIQRHKAGIRKADNIISRSENIMSLARQKGNAEAERVAGNALIKARDAKQKNKELRQQAELRKKRAETAIANVRNVLAKMSSVKSEIKSVVTNHSGLVYIIKHNETIRLGEGQAGYLEPGDTVRTLGNSSVEMQFHFLGGRGTLKLGEYSRFKVEENGTINMLKGKIHLEVERWEKFSEELAGKMGMFSVLTPTAIVATRGTEFMVFEREGIGTEIIVLEGIVDVKAIKGDKTFAVDAGYRIRVTKDGVVSGPEKIDLKKIQRWWER